MGKYYDGHYPDTSLSLDEIEERIAIEKEKTEQLTEWPKDTD